MNRRSFFGAAAGALLSPVGRVPAATSPASVPAAAMMLAEVAPVSAPGVTISIDTTAFREMLRQETSAIAQHLAEFEARYSRSRQHDAPPDDWRGFGQRSA